MSIWHTRNEHAIIEALGATRNGSGADGVMPDGRPFEVRELRIATKFRIQRDTHKYLVRKKGFYVFKHGSNIKVLDAKEVSRLIGYGRWWTDRIYPYKFLELTKVFLE